MDRKAITTNGATSHIEKESMTRLMWSGKKNRQDKSRTRKMMKKKLKRPRLQLDANGKLIEAEE